MLQTVLAILALAPAPVAPVMSVDTTAAPRSPRLSLSFDIGLMIGGPRNGLADQFRQAGYDDRQTGYDDAFPCIVFCGRASSTPYPTVQSPGAAWALLARLAVTPTFAVGLGLGGNALGGSTGRQDIEGTPYGDYIVSNWDSSSLWATAFWRPSSGIRLGGGPGWYSLRNDAESITVSRPGLALEAGKEWRTDRLISFGLTIRGHLIPTTDVPHDELVLRPSWSHLTISAGLGVRLF